MFGIKKNCLNNGKSLYIFIRRVIKQLLITVEVISLLSTKYRLLSNILLSKLSPYVDEIIGDHQCVFQRNRSTTDHIFCIHHVPEKKWEQCGAVHKVFVDFKAAYESVRRKVLYRVLIKAAIPVKLSRLKKCLNET
jgi:hypothetical protein